MLVMGEDSFDVCIHEKGTSIRLKRAGAGKMPKQGACAAHTGGGRG